MTQLAQPSVDLAKRLLSKVKEEEQLLGVIMNPMAGNAPRKLLSFPDACGFLHIDPPEDLLGVGARGQIRYIDLGILKRWIAEVFEDAELADAIGEVLDQEEVFGKQMGPVKELMLQRLEQCKAITA